MVSVHVVIMRGVDGCQRVAYAGQMKGCRAFAESVVHQGRLAKGGDTLEIKVCEIHAAGLLFLADMMASVLVTVSRGCGPLGEHQRYPRWAF